MNAVLLLFATSYHVLSSFRFERHSPADRALYNDSNGLMSCQLNNIGEVDTYRVSACYSTHTSDSWYDADRHAKCLALGNADAVRYH